MAEQGLLVPKICQSIRRVDGTSDRVKHKVVRAQPVLNPENCDGEVSDFTQTPPSTNPDRRRGVGVEVYS